MDIFDYQKVYEKLKNGEDVVPVSREEAIMMALIKKLGGSGGESGWSLKQVLDFTKSAVNLFANLYDIETLPDGIIQKTDTSNVGTTYGMFSNCQALKTIPELDTSNVRNMGCMFRGCAALETIPELDTSNATEMSIMFRGGAALETIPELDTSNAISMAEMFRECTALKTIPELDTSNVTDMTNMFKGCAALETIPELDTSNVINMAEMFRECTALKTIPELDTSNVPAMYDTFRGCAALETCLLKNIQCVGINLSYSPLLTLDSLIYIIKELRNTGSSKTLTLGSTNKAKLSDTYVKLVTITDDMRAADDLIDEKLPFEVCESTDDGAMLITSYVTKKNWKLA